jgi:hypothetical protein
MGMNRPQPFFVALVSFPDANHVAQKLEGGGGVGVAFVFQQGVDVGGPPIAQLDAVKQIGKLFLQVGVYKVVGLWGEGVKVENGRYPLRQVVGEEIAGNLNPGEGLFEEFVVRVGQFAHGGDYRRKLFFSPLGMGENGRSPPQKNRGGFCKTHPCLGKSGGGLNGRLLI